MAENVGAIYFTVEAETAKLISGLDSATKGLDVLESGFGKAGRSASQADMKLTKTAAAVRGLGSDADGASSSLGGLSKVLGGLLTLQGVNSLIQLAEGYNTMAERVRMATSSVEEYEEVQSRLLATANKTYRALSEAQEIYIQTADGLRAMGYSTDQALDITDSLSYSFVKNATAADRAQSALRAYDLALNKGKIDAMGWLTVVGAIPSVVADIALATGKTESEIRRMGASGEVTARMLNEGLRKSLDTNKKAADDMATTVADAFTALQNNLAVYVGEANQATGATNLISAAAVGLSDNIDLVVKSLMAAGTGALALYIARTGRAALTSLGAMRAASAQAAEELRLAQAHATATAAALAQAQANAQLSAMSATASRAADTHNAALARLAVAQKAAIGLSGNLLNVLGGPVGIIGLLATAAAGWYLFSDSTDQARGALAEMDQPLDEVIEKFKKLSEAQRAGTLVRYAEAQAEAATDARKAFDALFASISGVNVLRTDWSIAQWAAFREEINAAKNAGEDLTPIIRRAAEESGVSQSVVDTWLKLNGEFDSAGEKAARAGVVLDTVRQVQEQLAAATRDTAAAQRDLNNAYNDSPSDDYLKRLKDRTNTLRDGNKEVLKAKRYIAEQEEAGNIFSPERKRAILDEAAAHDNLAAARTKSTSSAKISQKTVDEAQKATEENILVVDRLAQSLYLAGLEGEALTVAQARFSLNKFADSEQVAQTEALARAIHMVAEAENNRQLLRQMDPIANESKRFEDELESLRKLNEEKLLEDQRYLDLKGQAERAHAANMQALQEANFRAQSQWNEMMMASLDALGSSGTSAISGLIVGLHSGADAARMLGNAVLNEVVGSFVQMGIAQVKAWVMGKAAQSAAAAGYLASVTGQVAANTALAAQAAFASTAAIPVVGPGLAPAAAATAAGLAAGFGAPAIAAASTTLAGGRQYGGPTQPGKMYRINENGAPEVFNAANGQQFMLPNTRGHVVSNKDASVSTGGEGAPRITLNLIEDASRAGQVDQQQLNDEHILNVCVASIRGGTKMAGAIEGTYGVRRQGR